VAGAYAERSPLLVISGAPGLRESDEHTLLHHRIRASDTQERFFMEVCAQTAGLDSGRTAVETMVRVLDAMRRESRSGDLELPRDSLTRPVPRPVPPLTLPAVARVADLQRRTGLEILEWMRSRERPVVLAGVELHRFGLQRALREVLEREGWPFATSLSGKSLLRERHPQYLGVYEGAMGEAVVREGDLWEAPQTFTAETAGPTLVSLALDPRDASDALRNLTTALGKKVKAGVAE
jgi:indolepyruvate decarboxylase